MRSARLLLLLSVLISLAGCGAAPVPCAVWSGAPMAPRDELALGWSQVGLDTFPTVTAEFEGHRGRFVLDTGANGHLADRSVAWWAGLVPFRANQEGLVSVHDAVGIQVWSEAVEASIDTGLRGVETRSILYAFELPAIVEFGVAGLLSPQRLAGDGALAIDLPAGRVRWLAAAEADASLAASLAAWRALSPRCPSDDGHTLFAVAVRVEGVDLSFVVDTGSATTSVFDHVPLATRLAPRAVGRRTSVTLGDAVDVPTVSDVEVEVDGVVSRVVLTLLPEHSRSRCGADGILGLDVLSRCQLVIARDRGAMRCS